MPQVYRPLPPAEMLWEMLEYEPLTGILRWRVKNGPKSRVCIGDVAGYYKPVVGYMYVKSSAWGKSAITAQRIIWKWVTGEDPGQMIVDHANLDKRDNRWWNLRLATASQSSQNRPRFAFCAQKLKGVTQYRSGWRARIWIDGKRTHLGYFATAEEAHAAYCAASEQYHGEFGRTT